MKGCLRQTSTPNFKLNRPLLVHFFRKGKVAFSQVASPTTVVLLSALLYLPWGPAGEAILPHLHSSAAAVSLSVRASSQYPYFLAAVACLLLQPATCPVTSLHALPPFLAFPVPDRHSCHRAFQGLLQSSSSLSKVPGVGSFLSSKLAPGKPLQILYCIII